ncbi:MDR family MFS transporter [Phyllobacterium leguminum]|uniref:EmrB/QacA subfamily drug resistance transporter n=1 Tax=Phyllobacterium leguminum TaxID=314237 RepID=A0A318T8C8_9HYPH|nr:MDR family MFS transporter [Phyllobacterium leguminum]PYE86865.1 EmrB/QacA subfamily drug resistance transporter [Phyllobacterium leguminum]
MTVARSKPAKKATLTHAETRSIVFGIMLAMLLGSLDQTIVATAMPTIGQDLGDVHLLSWIVTAYLLTATAVTPLYGKMADTMGRRVTLLVSVGLFVVGSVASALAPTMPVLIVARALQGLGGGGLMALPQTIIADVVSPKERGRYQGYIAAVFITSSIAGPLIGGFFAEHLHWSAIFWINVPLGFLAFWMTSTLLKKLPRYERPHRLDVLGAVLMASATVSLMLALNWGGLSYPWGSPVILGLFAFSAILWAGFIRRLMTAPEPLIPVEVLANRIVAMGTIAACFCMGTFMGLIIYLPIYLETVYGLSASQSGLAMMPLMLGTMLGATATGQTMARVAHYKRMPMVGLAVAVAALAFLAAVPRSLSVTELEVFLAIAGIGLGTLLPVSTVSIQNAVASHQMGTATSTMNFFRSLGGALVVAGFGAILMGGLPPGVAGHITMETFAQSFTANGLDIAVVFRWVFAAAAAGLLIALAAVIAMEERPLRDRVQEAPLGLE